jgi:DNA invertase Pin-like site-specific DNA recombinase
MFSLQVLSAVAQLERALIYERTKAGIKAAKAKGRLPGNPGLRERRPEALAKTAAARERAYAAKIQTSLDAWWPTVKRMRPDNAWEDVTRVLNQSQLHNPMDRGLSTGSGGQCGGWFVRSWWMLRC